MSSTSNQLAQLAPELAKQLRALCPSDCLLVNGDTRPNPGWQALALVEALLERERLRYDLAFAGCLVAALFIKLPWLGSVTLIIVGSSGYDDSGGSFWTLSLRATDVVVTQGAALPDGLLCEEGAFDVDAAEDLVLGHFEFEESAFAEAFVEPGDTDAKQLRLERHRIAELLTGAESVSGAAAAAMLWPEFQHLLGELMQPHAAATSPPTEVGADDGQAQRPNDKETW